MFMKKKGKVKARAPCRLGLGGGGSDIFDYFKEREGRVLSVAINIHSLVEVERTTEPFVKVVWQLSETEKIETTFKDLELSYDLSQKDNVDLVKAAFIVLGEELGIAPEGYRIHLQSMAKKNSGLGGSSALGVALLKALYFISGVEPTPYELGLMAYHMEREVAKKYGGYQDQFASAFGGFTYMTFSKDKIDVSKISFHESIINDLHASLVLFETPVIRKAFAHEIEEKKIKKAREEKKFEVLEGLAHIAKEMKRALEKGDITTFGELLDESWRLKRQLPGVATEEIDRLYRKAKEAGAIGGKLSGAGGGGVMFFVVPSSNRWLLINAMEEEGAKHMNFSFDMEGAKAWWSDS